LLYCFLSSGQSDAATYSSLDDYEDCTFYQSLHIAGIPVYQTLKKDRGEQLHYRNLPSPNLNTTASPISKATITGTDEPSPNGKPSTTVPYAVHKQSMEMYEPYSALQKTDNKTESVYEPLREPTQELYESPWQYGNFTHC